MKKDIHISKDSIIQGIVYLIVCAFGAYQAVSERLSTTEEKVNIHDIKINEIYQYREENKAQYKEILNRLNAIDLKLVEKVDKKYIP